MFKLWTPLCIPLHRSSDAVLGGGGDCSTSDTAPSLVGKPPSPNRSQSRVEANVFARLTSNLVQSESTGVESQYKGHVRRSDSRTRNAGGPLICSHMAEGHKGEVLSVCATDHLLFSASKGESGVSRYTFSTWVWSGLMSYTSLRFAVTWSNCLSLRLLLVKVKPERGLRSSID